MPDAESDRSGLERVWHDLGVLGLDFSLDTSPPELAQLNVGTTGGLLSVAGRRLGLIGAELLASADDQATMLADQTQDLVNEELGPAGVTWPSCPRHPHHPMVVVSTGEAGETAWWACPADQAIQVPIGQLVHQPFP